MATTRGLPQPPTLRKSGKVAQRSAAPRLSGMNCMSSGSTASSESSLASHIMESCSAGAKLKEKPAGGVAAGRVSRAGSAGVVAAGLGQQGWWQQGWVSRGGGSGLGQQGRTCKEWVCKVWGMR